MEYAMARRPMMLLAVVGVAAAGCSSWGTRAQRNVPAAQTAEQGAGKLIYDTHCARCHGVDGKDDTYPFIATLDGIGQRLTLDEILEETWATGFVAPQQFSPGEQRALARYVAGL
jgi:mono/diheme cytochrome c family protein